MQPTPQREIESVTRTLRRRPVAERRPIAFAEAVPIVFKRRRRHRRIAEARMPFGIGRPALRNIATRRFNAIVIAPLGNLRVTRRRRWWRSIDHWLGMRTSREDKGQRQNCECKCFAHHETLPLRTTNEQLRTQKEKHCPLETGRLHSLAFFQPGFAESVAHFVSAEWLSRARAILPVMKSHPPPKSEPQVYP